MIDVAAITKAVKDLLDANLSGYAIERNAERNVDINRASEGSGLINVLRGPVRYRPYTTGAVIWKTEVRIRVEVQYAHQDAELAEDGLQDAEKAVLDVLAVNRTLSGAVLMTLGYDIDYEYNADEQVYHHAAIITIIAETRA
jgi:hypothetical protein